MGTRTAPLQRLGSMLTATRVRVVCTVGIVVPLLLLAGAYVSADANPNLVYETNAGTTEQVVPATTNTTVVTTQRNGGKSGYTGNIVAFNPNGTVRYYNETYGSYWDVDPVPGTKASVIYVASKDLRKKRCDGSSCARNVVERLNLTTGHTERVYSHGPDSGRWHDVDRLSDNRLVVADISDDAVFLVNSSTGIKTWTWRAETAFPPPSGDEHRQGWTHLNDVEVLADGRIMASPRNLDQVVFLNRSGLRPSLTLGTQGDHDTLYEQHNPDYIPAADGGPAILVADSENSRIVEYQRTDGEWNRSWSWEDQQLQWPRDADRLPNGNTLITDTGGDRVIEVAPNGSVVWRLGIDAAYEAERIETGDESHGGPAATTASLQNRSLAKGGTSPNQGLLGALEETALRLVPSKITNGITFVLPWWADFVHALLLVPITGFGLGWLWFELRYRGYSVSVHKPIRISRR